MNRDNDERSTEGGAGSGCGLAALMMKASTRRRFIQGVGIGGAGLYVVGCMPMPQAAMAPAQLQAIVTQTTPTVKRELYQADPVGMVLADPTRCVGCRRCELACTEFNEGRAQPSMARVQVGRNYNYGPEGAMLGYMREEGRWGNHIIVQETCRQCPHPVPCASACPYGAIEVVGPANARVVNTERCQGCRTCQQACPWGMTSFDEELEKATKCHLCGGDPECVQACPVGALRYVPWQDLTRVIPQRHVVPAYIGIPVGVQEACAKCH